MSLVNIPNSITLFRIFLVPCFALFLIYDYHHYALSAYVVAGFSDALDGILARKLHMQTELGRFLDPLADKMLVVTSFIMFTAFGWIPAWLTITVLSKDLFILTGWILLFLLFNKKAIQPTIIGKTANALQMVLIGFVLLARMLRVSLPGMPVLLFLTTLFTILAGLHYLYRGLKQAHD